jgi:hypothetical protein
VAGAEAAARLQEELLPAIRTVWVDRGVHDEAVRAVAGRGRNTSLVDEVSFEVMRQLAIDTALAFDADFKRRGFRPPALPEPRRHTFSESPAPYGSATDGRDLVSVTELASRSGRSVNTIQSWRRRHRDFPAPNVELAAGPIWLWGDVSAWIDQRSRRPTTGSAPWRRSETTTR